MDEFESVLNKQHVVQMDTFIKLRGLPYSITPEEIESFFDGKSNGRMAGVVGLTTVLWKCNAANFKGLY